MPNFLLNLSSDECRLETDDFTPPSTHNHLPEGPLHENRAAELFMTQSCLSRHVNAVEKELGITLFIRSPTGIALTESGEVVA